MATAKSTTNGSGIPAVLYLRASSDKQETSVPDQRAALKPFAEKHGYRIVSEYVDEGISGDATQKRHEFQRMIADAAGGTFKAILVWDQDRFGRFDSIEAGFWIHPLIQAGVHLHSMAQGRIDWTDFAGRMIYQIQQEGKHAFLRDLSRNAMRGKITAAKSGVWLSRAPYGYRRESKRLVPGDPAEAEIVRRIFRHYVAGLSLRGIAERLNGEGVPSPTGREWRSGNVGDLLRNPAYVGTYRYNMRRVGKYHGYRNGNVEPGCERGKNPESDWIVIPDHHEALVDRETFDRVQRLLEERRGKSTPHRNGGQFLLSGLLRCGKCGETLTALKNCSGRVQYRCSGHTHKGRSSCTGGRVFQDDLVQAVASTIQRHFLDPERLAKLRQAVSQAARQTGSKTNVARLRKQVASASTKLSKAEERLLEVDRDMLPAIQDRVRDLREQSARLKAELEAAEKPQGRLQAEAERRIELAMEGVQRLCQALQDADPVLLREHLRQSIERVDVWTLAELVNVRSRHRLDRGIVHFRGGMAYNLSDTC